MNLDMDIKENIEKHGWQFQFVFDAKGENPDFSYSIGFEESFGHPEVMIFGLKRETMHTVLADLAHDIKKGSFFKPNVRIKDVISGGFDVLFKPLKKDKYPEYAGIATEYYNKPFRLLVMFWPDKNNILPTDQNCELTVQNEALEIV